MGGAGLVIAEMTDVSREARISPGCTGLYKPEHVVAWKRIVDFVHGASRAKIGIQIAHAGRKGSTRLMWQGMDEPLPDGNWPLVAASAIPYLPHSQVPREMTRADMDGVRDDFARAARMADAAGFDLIEIHFAHGYLLATFLSPLTNRRRDDYGGALTNRLRFPLEVFDAVRAAGPAAKPISVRISATDWMEGVPRRGLVEIARALKTHGVGHVDGSEDMRPNPRRRGRLPTRQRRVREAGSSACVAHRLDAREPIVAAAGRSLVLSRAPLRPYDRHAAPPGIDPLADPTAAKASRPAAVHSLSLVTAFVAPSSHEIEAARPTVRIPSRWCSQLDEVVEGSRSRPTDAWLAHFTASRLSD